MRMKTKAQPFSLWPCSYLQGDRKRRSNRIRSAQRKPHSSRLWNVNTRAWEQVLSKQQQDIRCSRGTDTVYVYYDVTCSLSQHTLRILLTAFDVEPLRKHEAASRLQPTGHLTTGPSHRPLFFFSLAPPHTILPRDSRLQCDHLSECFKRHNNVYCTVWLKDG